MGYRPPWFHWTPHSKAHLCSTLSSHSRTEGIASDGTCCSHGQKQKYKGPNQSMIDSTFKSSTQTWTYISSSHILLVKVSHMANPDVGGKSLREDTEGCPVQNAMYNLFQRRKPRVGNNNQSTT